MDFVKEYTVALEQIQNNPVEMAALRIYLFIVLANILTCLREGEDT